MRIFSRIRPHYPLISEDDFILRDLQIAYRIQYYMGTGLSKNHTGNNTIGVCRILTRNGYIQVYDTISNKWGEVPIPLRRRGVRGVYSFPLKQTILYAPKDNIMTVYKKGKQIREFTPEEYLPYFEHLDQYIFRRLE